MFNFLKAKKIGVFGLGITGIAAYKTICKVAQKIIVWDDKAANRDEFSGKFGASPLVDITGTAWQDLDQIILSPGVPPTHQVREIASRHGIEIISDIDLLLQDCKSARFVAVTGTNGKSTTTALIYHILKNAKFDFAMGGNIGVPALDLPLNKPGYVLELSSFQLDLTDIFSPSIAVLLNITPDHLDRYKTMENYVAAKEKILRNMHPEGYGIIGVDNEITKEIFEKFHTSNPKIIPISSIHTVAGGISVIGDKIYDNIHRLVLHDLPENRSLQGDHNRENVAASIAACRLLGVEYAQILEGIKSFKGLPHRAEYLGTYKNIHFYNDSKATNAEAASKSISFLDNIYWLAGGIAKEGGISELLPLFGKIKKAYLFGQDKHLFAETLKGKVEFEIYDDLALAFAAACKDALSNGVTIKNVLLAPAAASMDQFKNFEHRGEIFRQLFKDLQGAL